LLALLPAGVQPRDVRGYAGNVRFQRGLADRFQAGVVRSGRLLAEMRRILKANDVPEDLAYLPHVESSFDNRTLSRFGAAGIWQFTRGTGREFLKVGYEVDERLDPLRATEAAAQFLRNNYELLGNWPLAITAYNHGPQSLARITKHMGTTELGALIQRYNGRLFKFASKNFYAEFLAAREVATHITDYFSDVEPDPPLEFNTVALPFFLDADKAAAALGVKEEALRVLNPALRKSVWSGAKLIPAGYVLRIPPDVEPKAFIGALPAGAQQLKQKPTTFVVVARGDSLYSIGRRIGVPWQEIASANNLSSYRRLLPGQRLIIPGKGYQPPPAPAPKLEVAVNAPPQAESAEAPQAAPLASEPSAGPLDGTTTPEAPPGVPTALVQGDGQAPVKDGLDQAELLQDLKLREVDAQRRTGLLVASYGETLGYYADWAGVDVQDIRALNGMSSRSSLQPGRSLRIPLDNVSPEDFNQRRLDFHQTRVESFYSEYNITDKVKIRVQRGQSSWAIAQNNNVPMWLFYRENPQLLTEPIRPGMQLTLPIVQQSEQN
jgi:membrane-bound lytic murein transglycosylase D